MSPLDLFAERRAMHKSLFCQFVTAAIFCTTPSSAQSYKTYHNPRFGTTADVPADWQSNPPTTNGDGLTFNAPDGSARLLIYGGLHIWTTVAEGMAQYEIPQENTTVTYKHQDARSITVSGTKGDLIFYEKHILSCRNQIWNSIYLEYPAVREKGFDALVAHVAHSLRPGPGSSC
jgi:hypothetical protein